ncbi:MAG: hypothetical protein DRN29_04840 [Thermoplasmata archaeon]|nr:MAG: hypothetical protein DRN29_04840 [Thermoplasmata archaeon]
MQAKQFLVFSEYTDPAHHVPLVAQRVASHAGQLYFITKDPRPLVSIITDNARRSLVHITVTGLGSTKFEPHAPKPADLMPAVQQLARILKDQLVVRIDPIIFGANHLRCFTVMRKFAQLGVQRFRISYCSLYPFVRQRFKSLGIPTPNSFHYPASWIAKHSTALANCAQQLGVSIEYCAPLPQVEHAIDPRIIKTGCASDIEYRRLGYKPVPPQRKQRPHCKCWAKAEGLPEFKSCKHGCVYCYFSKS